MKPKEYAFRKPDIEEQNKSLIKEIIHYKETNELTLELKKIFMELIWLETEKARYKYISDNVKILCEAKAYEDCCKHAIRFNLEKSDKPNLYMGQIIWCSYINTIKKSCPELKTIRKRV
jgi:hypothetical protein